MRNLIFLKTSEAARRLEVTGDRVRQLERKGELAAIKIGGGMRLFRVEDVERLAAARAARRKQVMAGAAK